jgi:hypothetical protein
MVGSVWLASSIRKTDSWHVNKVRFGDILTGRMKRAVKFVGKLWSK